MTRTERHDGRPKDVLTPPAAGRHLVFDGRRPIFAVGDVHGRLDLVLLLEAMIRDRLAGAEADVLYLGDLVDRGRQTSGVLAHLVDPPDDGLRRRSLAGNHEAMMLGWLKDPGGEGWLLHGGLETLASYGLSPLDVLRASARRRAEMALLAIPEAHLAFLGALPLTAQAPGTLFVHAGVRPGVPLAAQTETDLLWIRGPFLAGPHGLGVRIIHGHSPTPEPDVADDRIGIDLHACASGRLGAVRIATGAAPEILVADAGDPTRRPPPSALPLSG